MAKCKALTGSAMKGLMHYWAGCSSVMVIDSFYKLFSLLAIRIGCLGRENE